MHDVLSTLRFVRGAVGTKDLMPEMKHFCIENGSVRAYNGIIALSSPLEFDFDCKPKAVPMVAAIGHCEDVVSLAMTDGGRLRIQSGDFRAFIDCIDGESPHLLPEGERLELDGEALMRGLNALVPFIGTDASRPWVNGILFRGQSAFATNNVCLVEYWLGVQMPFTVNIPTAAVKELIRIKEPPSYAQMCHHSVTFHYPDGRWVRTQLLEVTWPDLTKILDRPSHQVAMPPGFFEALATVKPFTEKQGLIYFIDGEIRTHQEDGLGAAYRVPGLELATGIYHLSMLELLDGSAQSIDFGLYPAPLLFYGDRLRGAIVGLRG